MEGKELVAGAAGIGKETRFVSGNGGYQRVASAVLPQPSKTKMQMDLEWAYRNMGTVAGRSAEGQRKAFIEDFLADRDKTLKLLAGLDKDYRAAKKLWHESKLQRKREEEQLALEMERARSVGEAGVELEDMGEDRVVELISRLLFEARGQVVS